jgi:Ser/Thr protein kinase RdoA (MazF antagonist)
MDIESALIKSRVNLDASLESLLDKVAENFSLGEIIDFSVETTGYEELNIKTKTSKGIFLVKVFSKSKSESTIKDYIKGLQQFQKAGVPTPSLLPGGNGYLYGFVEKTRTTYLCVMNYFSGETFQQRNVDKIDIERLVTYLSKIHSLSFSIHRNYDSWGTAHLIEEYDKKSKYISNEDNQLIQPIVNEYKTLRFDLFSKSIIHGDLQRTNVLKNQARDYCILDLGCMDFSYPVIDLSIFIAHFCLDDEGTKTSINLALYKHAVQSYVKERKLNDAELASIPTLVRATYAIYLIAANYSLQNPAHPNNSQTAAWIEFSKSGLDIQKTDLMVKWGVLL